MAAHPPRPNLAALTGLRFFAAIGVVFHHFGHDELPLRALRRLADAGFVGVDLFFLLSGFVLVYVYRPYEAAVRFRSFVAARVARIYPLYLLGLALGAPAFFGAMARSSIGATLIAKILGTSALHLTLTHAWVGHEGIWNVPDWSVSTEWFFYLAFPLLVPAVVRSASVARLAGGAAGLIAFGLAVAFAHHAWHPEWVGVNDAGTRVGGMLKYSPFGRLHEFLCGALVGRVWLLVRPVRGAPWLAAASVGAILWALTRARIPLLPLSNGLLAPLFAALIFSLADGRGFVARVLATKALVRLGDASYGVYILHWPLAIVFTSVRASLGGPPSFERHAFWPYLGFVLLVSLAAYEWFEVPMRVRVRALLERPSASRQPGGSG